MFIFDAATIADIPALCGLLNVLFTAEAEFLPDEARQRRALELIVQDPSIGQILCARSGSEPIGMVSLLYTISTAEGGLAAWLEDMVIHPDHRRSGIGSRLMDHAIATARSRGVTRISLLTDSVNAGAIRFYQRKGFTRSEMITMRLNS